MRKTKVETQQKPKEKPVSRDKIEDNWRPAAVVVEPEPDLEVYHTGRKLGKGGFAVCFEGTLKRTGQLFAMKVVKSRVEQKKQLDKFQTELQIHAKMRHPNIVEFYRAFSFDEHTYVILELCSNGSLMDMVKSRLCLSLPEVRRFMIQLCGGVKYMHQRAVIHRDLKMGNLFLDAKMNLKIGDFGLAAIIVSEKERRQTLCGTPNYIAPEILDKKSGGGHDHKVDTWAIGIICYAMLTGGPPFASKTQPEIYAKLKQLEYSWKTDGLNYIPPQAKELVASCLNLTATERPEMDDLVDHEFFRMGTVADELSPGCRSSSPEWLEMADPRGDRARRGYGVPYETICSICGVGKSPSGSNRLSVGENASKSALIEVELENKQGLAPVVPLPAGFLYRQFTAAKEDWTVVRKYPVAAPKLKGRKKALSPDLMDMNNVAVALPDIKAATATVLPPRAPMQSFAAQQRQAALPNRTLPRPQVKHIENDPPLEPRLKDNRSATVESTREYLRERPVRSISGMSTRSNSTREVTSSKAMSTKSTTMSEAIGRRVKSQLRSTSADVMPQLLKSASVGRAAAVTGTLSQFSDTSSSSKSSSTLNSSDSNEHHVRGSSDRTDPEINAQYKATGVRTCPIDSSAWKLLDPNEHTSLLRSSRPRDILASLRMFRDNISGEHQSSTNRLHGPSQPPPIVEKWVDYTGKYGIAYILSDHTVGCIFNSSESNSRPACCIVVRDGRAHFIQKTSRLSVEEGHNLLPPTGSPVEFYEHHAGDGLRKAVVPTNHFNISGGKANIQTTYDREKMKLVLLWDKFGKYMTKTLSSEDLEAADTQQSLTRLSASSSTRFLKFYQRIGNVGVWGFSSSSSAVSSADSSAFQFNFPDHTKLVLYENGAYLDLYHLQAADAIQLNHTGNVSPRALERRRLMTIRVSDVIAKIEDPSGSSSRLRSIEKDVLTSNQVEQKLQWIRDVMDIWIKEGGLGKMGSMEAKIWWKGLQEGGRGKLVWVTVGREGGDGKVVTNLGLNGSS
ncbi:putative serine threonine protein [Phaeomoniella chlamydospora]|uniref:Putative serine threonine protein n=1 Tax=Phaeomoniella chlamydospora TaxID=158046 RepID=A0A0G2HD74_PHACM|nr:putative serine threonine protein [Phaeomoniella chlamydospora]